MTISEKIRGIRPTQLIIPMILFLIFIGAIIGIINYQNNAKLKETPKLEIISPADGALISDANVVVNGSTTKGNKVTINEKEAKLNDKNVFYEEVPLTLGENTILVIVTNKNGTKNEAKLKITRTGKEAEQNIELSPGIQGDTEVSGEDISIAGDGKGSLSTSGPETYWILESTLLSAAGAAWMVGRKKFKDIVKK